MVTTTLHCPHCGTELDVDPSAGGASGARCPGCRLIVAAGRGIVEETGDDGRVSQGRSAGILAATARRADAEPIAPELVLDGIEQAAQRAGVGVGRLRMTDYVQEQAADPAIPSLASVLATFPAWKVARDEADRRRADRPGGAEHVTG